ncbi:hypothetical protein [Lolliginicoccus levis]|uniref:hypothetical protein n=1 Tax=Lolliginicoccus levis TaxID=2919542 RepID=UPI00241DA30F|nr:hypothetical protein [Lolliginicoccus levis]
MTNTATTGNGVWMFVNNPHVTTGWPDPHGISDSYDIVTAPDTESYSVGRGIKLIGPGDIGLVYRADRGAQMRKKGKIVAVARITSTPQEASDGNTYVEWELCRLPPEAWIDEQQMLASGNWTYDVRPFGGSHQAPASRVRPDQWEWLKRTLPSAVVDWLKMP